MRITVVVPVYNSESTIERTIASVFAQSISEWRMVIVDDGSTDQSSAILASYSDPRISIVTQENRGVSSARNLGMKHVSTDYVMFLDSDDEIHPTALERLLEAAGRHSDAVAVFGTTMRFTPEWELEMGQKPPQEHQFHSGDVLRNKIVHNRVFWNAGQMAIKTETVRAVGGYNENLAFNEDWEFFVRLAAMGDCIFIGPQEEILRHQVRQSSVAPTRSPVWENHLPAIETVFGNQTIEQRFSRQEWASMRAEVTAGAMFECGRQNFIKRRFGAALSLMLRSMFVKVSKRRLAFFALAIGSSVLRTPLHGRLRFHS